MFSVRNSKRGFSLPLAIGITCVLVLLSASLMFIASNSISNTSSDVTGRQAYLNVKSALDYARSYYSGVTDFKTIGKADGTAGKRIEYLTMNDVGGTTSQGAKRTEAEADIDDPAVSTYVIAEYNPPAGAADPATLKLTGYARYSDAFGVKGKNAHLSVTYNINAEGGGTGRITVASMKNKGGVGVNNDGITLHVKKPNGLNWALATYIWTYKDVSNIYTGLDDYQSYEIPTPAVSKVNANENDNTNISYPGGLWVTGSGDPLKNGPSTTAVQETGNWYANTFHPDKKDVHYFNVILSKRGGLLEHGTTDTQSLEMFHLWYLDKSDKNIYFDIKKTHIYYYSSNDWDGKKNLETLDAGGGNWVDDPTIMVYVKNPKTTVHVNFVNGDEERITSSLSSAPVINNVLEGGSPLSGKSYLHSGNKYTSGIAMEYEGCGWWVANIESGRTFTMEIPYDGASRSVGVNSYTNKEAWIIYNKDDGSFTSYSSEEAACDAAGISKSSYVTVHAKGYDWNNPVSAVLNYKDVAILSSSERVTLGNKINEANEIKADDFDDASYKALSDALTEGTDIYNDVNYISNAPGPSNALRIKQAADGYTKGGVTYIGYKKATENIQNAIENLNPKTIDTETYKKLSDLIAQGDELLATKGIYDFNKLSVFSAGVLTKAKTDIADTSCTMAVANTDIDALTAAITDIQNNAKLDKTILESLVAESKLCYEDTNYDADAREVFRVTYEEAAAVLAKEQLTQEEIDNEVTILTEALNILKATYRTPLDMSALDSIMSTVSAYLNSSPKENFTDDGLKNLQSVYASAEEIKTSVKATQEQVNEAAENLQNAYNNCIVIKPTDSDDALNANGKINVYVFTGVEFKMQQSNSKTAMLSTVPFSDFSFDASSGLYCYTVDKNTYDTLNFIYTYQKDPSTSQDISSDNISLSSYTDNNIVVMLSADKDNFSVQLGKLTTLLFQKDRYTANMNVSVNGVIHTLSSLDSVYNAVKFVNTDGMSIIVNDNGEVKSEFTAQPGQWIVQPGSNEPVSVNLVYPIYESKVSSGSDYSVSKSLASNSLSYYSIEKLKTSPDGKYEIINEIVDVPIDADQSLIILDLSDAGLKSSLVAENGGAPYLYASRVNAAGETEDAGSAAPGSRMMRYRNTDVFYAIVPKTADKISITSGDKSKTSNEVALGGFSYYLLNSSNVNSGSINIGGLSGSNTSPSIDVYYLAEDMADSHDSITMPFVGGKKVRIVNRSYAKDYGDWQKMDGRANPAETVGGYKPFGGYQSGYNCFNRIGNSELKPYYDWCEVKIPVSQASSYTFEVKGLDNTNSSTKNVISKEIRNATGDIWITLNSTAKSGGRYSDVNVYTFDPDESDAGSDQKRVYFAVPSGWNESSLKITYAGASGSTTQSVNKHLTRAGLTSYYYYDVNTNTPFITYTITDNTGNAHTYKTSLQAEDKVLFDPTISNAAIEGGVGAWVSFVSDQDKLKEVVFKAQSMYYGDLLIKKYTDTGASASDSISNYSYPEGLKNKYLPYSTAGSGTGDDTIRVDVIQGLSDTEAANRYNDISSWVNAYSKLYSKMLEARAYIRTPVSGGGAGFYPEYLNRTSKKEYTSSSVANLRNKLIAAESSYANSGSSISDINSKALILQSAIENMKVENEGAIALILYDAQGIVKSSDIVRIHYDGCPGGSKVVNDVNTENYPIIFVEANSMSTAVPGEKCIKNVYFSVNGAKIGATAGEILDQKSFVMMYTSTNPEWTENSVIKYEEIQSDELMESGSDDLEYQLEDNDGDGKLDPMALYFEQDVAVKKNDGSLYYNIKAGVYYFEQDEPPVDSTGKLRIFSDAAKTFFTNPNNYGEISGATTSDAQGWTSSGAIKSSGTYAYSPNSINFIASSGELSSAYASRLYALGKGSMYFRWDSTNNLVVGRTVTFSVPVPKEDKLTEKVVGPDGKSVYAPSIIFASAGTITSSKTSPHFYFSANTASSDKMLVTFKTDTKVSYRDSATGKHEFVIREGTYIIKKKDSTQSYIADLFDETYWKSREYVESVNGLTSNPLVSGGGGSKSSLSDGVYSN